MSCSCLHANAAECARDRLVGEQQLVLCPCPCHFNGWWPKAATGSIDGEPAAKDNVIPFPSRRMQTVAGLTAVQVLEEALVQARTVGFSSLTVIAQCRGSTPSDERIYVGWTEGFASLTLGVLHLGTLALERRLCPSKE